MSDDYDDGYDDGDYEYEVPDDAYDSGDGWAILDDGTVVDTETGEILGDVDDDDFVDIDDGCFWDDVADLNDHYA